MIHVKAAMNLVMETVSVYYSCCTDFVVRLDD